MRPRGKIAGLAKTGSYTEFLAFPSLIIVTTTAPPLRVAIGRYPAAAYLQWKIDFARLLPRCLYATAIITSGIVFAPVTLHQDR